MALTIDDVHIIHLNVEGCCCSCWYFSRLDSELNNSNFAFLVYQSYITKIDWLFKTILNLS